MARGDFATADEAAAWEEKPAVCSHGVKKSVPSGVMTGYGNSEAWHRVSVETRRVQWPRRCACCGEHLAVMLDVRTPKIWWQLPYCHECREHAEKGQNIDGVARSAMVACGTLGAVAALAFDAWQPGLMVGLGGVLGARLFSESLIAGLFVRHRSTSRKACCDYRPAARFKSNEGNLYVWEFRSREFAQEFCALNGGEVSSEAGAALEAKDSDSARDERRPRIAT